MSDPAVTVCLCAYNAEDRVGKVLSSFSSQQHVSPTEWEVLIVCNNCTDHTEKIVKAWVKETNLHARIINESKQGLAHVRKRGTMEAHGDVICFIDDDNILTETWVAEAIRFFAAHPSASMAGGRVLEQLECPRPDWWEEVKWMLAICDADYEEPCRRDINPKPDLCSIPVGAGLCIRTAVLRHVYATHKPLLLGPVGSKRVSGSDMDIGGAILREGGESWFVPGMVMHHMIPQWRLEKKYLVNLRHNIVRCNIIMEAVGNCGRYPPTIYYAARYVWWNLSLIKRYPLPLVKNSISDCLSRATIETRIRFGIVMLCQSIGFAISHRLKKK